MYCKEENSFEYDKYSVHTAENQVSGTIASLAVERKIKLTFVH